MTKSNQDRKQQQGVLALADARKTRPVECLGMMFEDDAARRAYFIDELTQKLSSREFRKSPGFPEAADDDILRISDPPYYTACPNPFLEDFVAYYGSDHAPKDGYRREPFAVDVSEGKNSAVYKGISYYTKVPYEAIVPSILHYTMPGDIVLDGFCGSGMTGVAAQWCGTASQDYRSKIEEFWQRDGRGKPSWGVRRCILGDLGPAATFTAAAYNTPFDVDSFSAEAQRILDEVQDEMGWMYETLHADGKTKGRINYMVWSEVFSCPSCTGEVVFTDNGLDRESKKVLDEFPCPSCSAGLTKRTLDRILESYVDEATGEVARRIKLKPVLVNYSVGRSGKIDKQIGEFDLDVLRRIDDLPFPKEAPIREFPLEEMYHGSRLGPKGFTRVHQLFTKRAICWMSALSRKASEVQDATLARALKQLVLQQVVNGSLRNSYRPGASFGNRAITGVYYVSSMPAEASIFLLARGTLRRLKRMAIPEWLGFKSAEMPVAITTQSTVSLKGIPKDSVDYVFTDPPFGENIFYADLSQTSEAWLGVTTAPQTEAIVDRPKGKGTLDYQDLMRRCFEEYYRVLKPGRWMTVVFSNSRNSVWRAIQEAIGIAGFVTADVRTLDKQQGSYRQVTSTAVKQDLVISAYKPTQRVTDRFELGVAHAESAWTFMGEHLGNLPVFVGESGTGEVLLERTPQMLMDRMIAFHVQRGLEVPVAGTDFLTGLAQRYLERDGMFFLPDQVTEYDRKRTSVGELRQLTLFVTDEASAIQWLRQQLHKKPQTFQELQPQFMRELQSWAKHESTVELKEILEQNFLHYEGEGPVPSQIHAYLSTNFKDLRNLGKNDRELRDKAKERWYVPDTGKQVDLERMRDKALLREFEAYKTSTGRKLKRFRTEAVRTGFKAAYDAQDYRCIVDVAEKIPDRVLQEDEKLLMYYDVASTRLGED